MTKWFFGLAAWVIAVAAAFTSPASAQTNDAAAATRPATTTFLGDTGLWFVPTGEVLPDGKVSVSAYRTEFDREQGFTNIAHGAITFGVGVGDRLEVFGSFRASTRLDRDIRPLFHADVAGVGGLDNSNSRQRTYFSGNGVGDLLIGTKISLMSEYEQRPAAVAIRGIAQLPTGADEVGTGKASFFLDAIISKHVNDRVEVAGFGGVALRGDPDGIAVSHGVRWGFGAGFPMSRAVRLFTELHGEALFDDTTVSTPLVAQDGSLSPLGSPNRSPLDATVGVLWQGSGGLFAGAGLNVALRHRSRSVVPDQPESASRDRLGFQVRLGFHPGTRVYVPPPPPPPPAPPVNQPPTVTARCAACTVNVGEDSTVTAQAQDPDGDALTYRWSAEAGSFADPTASETAWTAPNDEGPVPVTVTVNDGRGGEASDSVSIQVVRPVVREFVFEDVHFDFDRYTLRPSAIRVLDEAVAALEETTSLQIEIAGHTCNIGTAEYNLALGDRRAQAVRDYLVNRGVTAGQLRTVSFGEEQPQHDNAREETRRLNRRAAMTVRVR